MGASLRAMGLSNQAAQSALYEVGFEHTKQGFERGSQDRDENGEQSEQSQNRKVSQASFCRGICRDRHNLPGRFTGAANDLPFFLPRDSLAGAVL